MRARLDIFSFIVPIINDNNHSHIVISVIILTITSYNPSSAYSSILRRCVIYRAASYRRNLFLLRYSPVYQILAIKNMSLGDSERSYLDPIALAL